jgi:hypothetical protein
MLTFLINPYCPRAYHRPEHSIHIIEYHRKKKLSVNPTSSPGLEPRTVFGIVVFVPAILALFFYHAKVSELQKPSSLGLEHRTPFPEF